MLLGKSKMKVNFIVTQSFLRTKDKTDPFYDPIIRAIDGQRDIEWKVFVWQRGVECGYSADRVSDYWLFEKLGIWFYRVCHLLFWSVPVWKIYCWYGMLSRILFSKKFDADIVITQSGQFGESLSSLLPHTRIVDIQHGVIYSRHSGYFGRDGRINEAWRRASNREFWLYGQGYADCFFKHPDNGKDLKGRVKVIGDVIRAGEKVGVDSCSGRDGERDVVVFSLQLTADLSREEMSASVAKMEEFFADFFKRFGDKYVCYVKHHPRFNNVYDLSSFYAKFPQVKETKKLWTELYDRMALHLTFNSTVTFDCASHGVPTFLVDLPSAKIIMRNFYKDDYDYPYYDKSVSEILELPVEESRLIILAWYHHFYTQFSVANCIQLLRGEV